MLSGVLYMRCPSCLAQLTSTRYKEIVVDRCIRCDGLWFDAGELRSLKNRVEPAARWLDIDLWADDTKFVLRRGRVRQCPRDGVPLYEVEYEEPEIVEHRDHIRGAGVRVDICAVCGGMWLDDGEFRAILGYVRARVDRMKLAEYLKAIKEQGIELVSGDEGFFSELADILMIQELLAYRMLGRMPMFAELLSQIP